MAPVVAGESLRTAAELREYVALLDGVSDAVITLDPQLRIRTWSRGAEEMYGWLEAEAMGQSISDLLRTEYVEGSREALLVALRTHQRWSGEFLQERRDRNRLRVVCTSAALVDERGEVTSIVAVNRDVTEQRRAELASSRLVALVESSGDAIVSTNLEGVIESWNRGAERLHGYAAEEAIGQSLRLIVPPDRIAELERLLERIQRAQAVERVETRRLHKDGSSLDVALTMSPIHDRHGRAIGVSTIAHDITEQRRLEDQLMLAGRMASVGTLAAGVAHEINNPLAYVMSNLQLVEEELGALVEVPVARRAELVGWLREAREGSERIRRIVRGLRTFSPTDKERRVPIEVRALLETAIDLSANELRHRTRLVTDFQPAPTVEADEARLVQVFINLLINAAQAMPEGRFEEHEIHVATATDTQGRAVVRIRDNGVGIPEHVRDRVFDPFFTTKQIGVGTGLGLSISHNVVTAHGGEIDFETEVGRGTVFEIRLPPARLAPAPRVAVAAPARRGRVLIVDDEPVLARALARMFERDHEVVVAGQGLEALARLQAGERFDAILCDLMMPELTGMELHAELLTVAPDQAARMIFVTGGAFTAAGKEFLDRVANPRIEKPVEVATLRSLVHGLM